MKYFHIGIIFLLLTGCSYSENKANLNNHSIYSKKSISDICINSDFVDPQTIIHKKVDADSYMYKNIEGRTIQDSLGERHVEELEVKVEVYSSYIENCQKVTISIGDYSHPYSYFEETYYYFNNKFVFFRKFDGVDLSKEVIFNYLHPILGASTGSLVLENKIFEYSFNDEKIIMAKKYKYRIDKDAKMANVDIVPIEVIKNILNNASKLRDQVSREIET